MSQITPMKYNARKAPRLITTFGGMMRDLGLPDFEWECTPSPGGNMILMGTREAGTTAQARQIMDAYKDAGVITQYDDGPAHATAVTEPEPDDADAMPPNAWVSTGQGFIESEQGTAMLLLNVVIGS